MLRKKSFDFMDITNGRTYQISIGGVLFPQLQLNTGTNGSAIVQELQKFKAIYVIPKIV